MQADSADLGAVENANDTTIGTSTDGANGTQDAATHGTEDDGTATRTAALTLAALLLLAGVAAAVVPLLGVAGTADGSPLEIAAVAAWVAALPGLLAVGLALGRPSWGLAATAGGGVMGAVRLLADLAVLTSLDGLTRPELFYETTGTARPFGLGSGAWVLLAADLLALVVGLVAITRLVGALGVTGRIGDELLPPPAPTPAAGRTGDSEAAPATTGAGPPSIGPDGVGSARGETATVEALTNAAPVRTNLNIPMLSVGFLGGVLLMLSALEIPYTGGYLSLRILPLGTSLAGVLAAAATPLIVGVLVVVAAALPRRTAIALLAGTAVAGAVPSLTALVAVLTGAPASLSGSVWWGLFGALVLGLSGLLARRGYDERSDESAGSEAPAVRSSTVLSVAAGVLALAAGALSFGASRLPLLLIDGAAPDGAAAEGLEPGRWPFAPATVPLLVAGLLVLVPPVSRAGRAATAVVWAGPVYALVLALTSRSLVVNSAQNPLNVELPEEFRHVWTAGPGLWLGGLAAALAAIAAVVAVLGLRRDADASLRVAVDESVSASRRPRVWTAGALTLVVVIALSLPVYGYLGRPRSVTLWGGYGLDTWGVWVIGLAVVGAVWAAAAAQTAQIAAALPLAAAAVAVQPLLLPAAVTGQPGFERGAGTWAGWLLVAMLVLAAPAFGILAGKLRTVDASGWRAGWPDDPGTGQQSTAAAPAALTPPTGTAARGRKAGRT